MDPIHEVVCWPGLLIVHTQQDSLIICANGSFGHSLVRVSKYMEA